MKTVFHSYLARYAGGIVLVLALMACGLSGGQGAATPTLMTLPDSAASGGAAQPTQAPAGATTEQAAGSPAATKVYVGTAGEGAPVDVCKLVTPDEAQAVLGGPVTRTEWAPVGQDCVLSRDDTHLMIVQAGHDADGKALHFGGMEGQRGNIKDPLALQLLDEISAEKDSLTLPQLVQKALPVWRAAGFSAEEMPGISDWAFWFYGKQAYFGSLAEIGAGRASGAWIGVYTTAPDEATGKALLTPLAVAVLGRLPDDFTLTGTNSP